MRSRRLQRILSGAVSAAALLAFAVVPARAAGNTTLPNNVPPWVPQAQLIGASPLNGQVNVSLYLNLQNESGLQSFIQQLYQPGSSQYHHFLTPAQFRAAYSPAASDVAAVQNFLSARGLKVDYTPANGAYVDATGSVQQAEHAFNVQENQYNYRGQNLRANPQAPTIPSNLAGVVSFVGGLDETYRLIKPDIQNDATPGQGYSTPGPCSTYWADHSATVSPSAYQYGSTMPWTPCGYTPPQIRAAYGVNGTTATGAGVTVGITDAFASPTIVQDANRFSANYGLPQLTSSNFQQIVVPGTYNYPENLLSPQGWYGEESLDVEMVHSVAPDAKIVYAGAQNSFQPLDHALIYLIDNGLANVISNSWGILGDPSAYGHLQADERAFEQAAAQGISVLFSSGDDGDTAALTGTAQGSWPATSPYVTAVGGTSLALANASGAKSEWGWGTYKSTLTNASVSADGTSVTGSAWSPWAPYFQYGSGGGISFDFAQPSYQSGVVPQALATSTTTSSGGTITFSTPHRVTPDVSMVGDPNTGVLYGQTYDTSGNAYIDAGCTAISQQQEYCERRIGGTSVASPLFAGVLALVDSANGGPVGFVNPALYALSSTSGALVDVNAPSNATSVLRNVGSSTPLATTLRTINSYPVGTTGKVVEGADSSLRTTRGYDDVTGLGTPNVPNLIAALSH